MYRFLFSLFVINLLSPIIMFGQNVHIPDMNFKSLLVGNPYINTNGDTEIQLNEAIGLTGDLWCNDKKINDLKTNIQSLFKSFLFYYPKYETHYCIYRRQYSTW
ncbi:hypothetical protein EB118_11605 [bacterium]|nr:hypothetical protein [bacterium]